jgi:hypothetical protein
MRLIAILLTFFGVYLGVSSAYADFYIHTWDSQHTPKSILSLKMEGNYFSSNGNFDAGGSNNIPSGMRNYTRIQSDLTARYGLFSTLTLYGRTSWAYISQNGDVRPGTGYGFADQSFGLNYRIFELRSRTKPLLSPPIALDIQAQVDAPGYSTNTAESSLTPYLGDGTTDMTAGIFGTVPILIQPTESFSATAGIGYTRRSAGFSSAIPWSAKVSYQPHHDGLTASFKVNGLTSLKTDLYGVAGSTTLRSNVGSGGSFYIGAVNPSLISIQGSVGYKLEASTELLLTATQTVWGQASPNYMDICMGFQTRWGGQGKTNPIRLTPNAYGRSNKGFVNYSLDTKILKSNDRLSLVKIDKGSQDGVEVGQLFDIFVVKKDGQLGDAIARGQVTSVKGEEAALDVTEFYKEVWIEEGFIAKRLIQ